MSCKPTYKGKRYNSLEELKSKNNNYNGEPAFFNPKTNTAYLVKGKANKTSAIHEIFTHPFLLQIEKTNPELYSKILEEAKGNKKITDYVNDKYKGSEQKVLDHEYIARAMDLYAQNELDLQKDKGLIARLKEIWKKLSKELRKLFSIPEAFSKDINPNTTLEELTQYALYGKGKMDLKNYSDSSIITDILQQKEENPDENSKKQTDIYNIDFEKETEQFSSDYVDINEFTNYTQEEAQYEAEFIESGAIDEYLFSEMGTTQNRIKNFREKYDKLSTKQKELLNKFRNMKRLLKRKLSASKSISEQAKIQARIDTISTQVIDILDDYDKIIDVAKSHLHYVSKEFKKLSKANLEDYSKEQIDAKMDTLNTLKNFINAWRDINLLYPVEDNNEVSKILTASVNLEQQFYMLAQKYFLASAQKYKNNVTAEDFYENQTDISRLTALSLNAYTNNSAIAKYTMELMEKAQFEAAREAKNAYNSLQDEYERVMRETGLSKKQLEEAILDKDITGKPINSLIERNSLEFRQALAEKLASRREMTNLRRIAEARREENKKSKKIPKERMDKFVKEAKEREKDAKQKLSKWLEDNTYSMTVDILNKLQKGEKVNTTRFTSDELRRQKKLLERYNNDKRMFLFSLLELDPVENEDLSIDDLVAKIEPHTNLLQNYVDWDKKNNPFDALTAKKRRSSRYLIHPVPKEQWYNEDFMKLQKNPILFDFYNYVLDFIEENNSHYPMSAQKDLQKYLPNVPKTQWEIIRESKVGKFINILHEDFVNSISSELNNTKDANLVIDGKTISKIPIRKTREIDRTREKIDLFESLKQQTISSRLYKFNTEVQPIAELADAILGKNEVNKTTESGAYVKNVYNELFKESQGAKNTRDQLRHAIDTYIYNKSRNKASWHLFKIFTKEEVDRLNNLSQSYTDELNQKLAEGQITKEEYDEAQKYNLDASDPRASIRMYKQKLRKDFSNNLLTKEEFNDKIAFIDSIGRKVTDNNLTDFAIKWSYLQALALPNVFSPTVNLIQGVTTNIIYSARKTDFTFKDLMQASKLISKAVFSKTVNGKRKVTGDFKKIMAFSNELNLIEDFNEHTNKSWLDKLSLFQQKAEWMNHVLTMVAFLKHMKVNTIKGETSLWDAYTYNKRGDLVWDTENYGEEVPHSNLEMISEDGGVNMFKVKLRLNAITELIHGDYAHIVMSKRSNLGKVLMLFRTWLPKAVEARFGKEKEDERLGRTRKGRYRSVIEGFKTKEGDRVSMGEFLLSMIPFKDSNLKLSDLSEVDQENIRANLAELYVIGSITAAILLAELASDDDDDFYTKKFKIFALNIMSRSLADVLFFINPRSSYKVFDKVIPIYTPISSLFSIVDVTLSSITQGATIQQGPFKGMNRFLKWGITNIPVTAGGAKNITFAFKRYDMN